MIYNVSRKKNAANDLDTYLVIFNDNFIA